MAEQQETIIIDVQVDTGRTAQQLADASRQVAMLTEEQKKLRKALAEGNGDAAEQAKELAKVQKELEQYKREVKSATAILQAAGTASVDTNQSLDQQRQTLNTLQKAYAGLSGEQRALADAEGGLRDQIKALSDSVKEQESAIGDNRRNVGNYAESITKAFGDISQASELMSPAISILNGMGGGGQKAAKALKALQDVMKLVGKNGQFLANTAKAATTATQGETVAQEGLNAAMNANPIGLIISAMTTLLPLIESFTSSTGDAAAMQAALNTELEHQNYLLNDAKRQLDLAIALAKAQGKSEQEILQMRQQGAREAYDIAQANEDATYAKLMQAHGKQREELEEHYNKQKEITAQAWKDLQTANDAITIYTWNKEAERQKASEKAAADRAEQEKKNAEAAAAALLKAADEALKIQQQLEDAKVALIQDESDRAYAARELAGRREIDALYKRLEEEENLTVEARDNLSATIIAKEELLQQDLQRIADEGAAKRAAANQAYWDAEKQATEEAKQRAKELKDMQVDASMSLVKSLGDAFKTLGKLMDEFGENNEEAKRASKAFAMVGILADQAQAISAGVRGVAEAVAAGAGEPFPYNLAAIAAGVAAVTSTIASVVSGIVEAKNLLKEADGYEGGGIVPGTSYHGDHVVARVNSREAIITPEQQKNLLDVANGQSAGQYDMMRAAMIAALQEMPAPTMVYEEFKQFQQEVANYQEIASI